VTAEALAAARTAEWKGAQGMAWALRNPATVEALDAHYRERFGVTRTALNAETLADVPRDARVLEIGCSAGRQLDALARSGFANLYGVDVSAGAVALCKWPAVVADGLHVPFADRSVDLVMTSGTLMQIPPHQRDRFMAEMQRVSKRWIYGCEMWTARETLWDFGDLMPPAWTYDWFERLPASGWPITRQRLLEGRGGKPLALYLLERPA